MSTPIRTTVDLAVQLHKVILTPSVDHFQFHSDSSITTGKQRCLDCDENVEKLALAQPGPGRRTSSKIRKVLEILKTPVDEDHQVKTIIFSQFTSMLDVIDPFLRDHGIVFGRCDTPLFHSILFDVFSAVVRFHCCSCLLSLPRVSHHLQSIASPSFSLVTRS